MSLLLLSLLTDNGNRCLESSCRRCCQVHWSCQHWPNIISRAGELCVRGWSTDDWLSLCGTNLRRKTSSRRREIWQKLQRRRRRRRWRISSSGSGSDGRRLFGPQPKHFSEFHFRCSTPTHGCTENKKTAAYIEHELYLDLIGDILKYCDLQRRMFIYDEKRCDWP